MKNLIAVSIVLLGLSCSAFKNPTEEYVEADVQFANLVVPYLDEAVAADPELSDLDKQALTQAIADWLFMVQKAMEALEMPATELSVEGVR